ncbi:acyl-ACP desaturase [Virgisporangium aliadipatigenens]|uniref:acyl-ACP desaturase n=1 Tax=Virgisporangium aliadipatigenens TaxID=741659 RepID=UPI0019421657|nr:acyl-ACP desaturase [Virgisporangium aliadipatigenens]
MSTVAPLSTVDPPREWRGLVDLGEMRALVGDAVARGAARQWAVDDLDWAALRPERLTRNDRSAVRFLTFIEDHIPGYLTYFLELFPLTGAESVEEFCFNREYFRFLVAWAYDEERHATVLTRYQVDAGITDADTLMVDLAEEGRKKFTLPHGEPVQAFTYALVQEKATQLFYQRFREVVREPLLRDLLSRLARDEARHFAFYSRLVEAYVARHGLARTVPDLKDVLASFKMPLADTLRGYWRWSLQMADDVGYDHTEAYDALVRLVNGFGDSRGEASAADLAEFAHRLRGIEPGR